MTLSKTESVWIEDDRGASNIWVLFVEKSLEGCGVAKDKGRRQEFCINLMSWVNRKVKGKRVLEKYP